MFDLNWCYLHCSLCVCVFRGSRRCTLTNTALRKARGRDAPDCSRIRMKYANRLRWNICYVLHHDSSILPLIRLHQIFRIANGQQIHVPTDPFCIMLPLGKPPQTNEIVNKRCRLEIGPRIVHAPDMDFPWAFVVGRFFESCQTVVRFFFCWKICKISRKVM